MLCYTMLYHKVCYAIAVLCYKLCYAIAVLRYKLFLSIGTGFIVVKLATWHLPGGILPGAVQRCSKNLFLGPNVGQGGCTAINYALNLCAHRPKKNDRNKYPCLKQRGPSSSPSKRTLPFDDLSEVGLWQNWAVAIDFLPHSPQNRDCGTSRPRRANRNPARVEATNWFFFSPR